MTTTARATSDVPASTREPRVDVLGVEVSAVTLDDAVSTVRRWIDTRHASYVCVTGVHGVMESQADAALRRIHNESGLTVPDGMPLVWCCRAARAAAVTRVYGPDLMLALCEVGIAPGWGHFLYGATDEVLADLAASLRFRFPGIRIVGTYAPPFRPLTDAETVLVTDCIETSGADLVWVGLSTPKQERWMAEFRPRLGAPVLLGVGAAFDFHAGRVRQAPPLLQRLGLEWAFRLAMEPRRLWRRYARNNPRFVARIVRNRPILVIR